MRRKWHFLILILLALHTAVSTLAQQTARKDLIVAEKTLIVYKYAYQGKDIEKSAGLSDFRTIMGDDPDALTEVRRAERLFIPGLIIGAVGAALIGAPFVETLVTGEVPNYTLARAGVGLVLIGINVSVIVSENRLKRAVDIYNANVDLSSRTQSLDLEFVFAPNRIILVLTL